MTKIDKLFATLNGCAFAGIDTLTEVKVSKNMPGSPRGKNAIPNPHFGRVSKRMTGAQIMVFANKNSSGYVNMVRRRLEAEGKNPDDYKPQDRVWGERLKGTPMVKKVEKDGSTSYYFEAIFMAPGKTEYLLDGVTPINKEDVIGLSQSKPNDAAQGGLGNMVQIRTFKLDSITQLRADGLTTIGPFTFTE